MSEAMATLVVIAQVKWNLPAWAEAIGAELIGFPFLRPPPYSHSHSAGVR
ncbi:hypothetical protein [Brevibacterium sp. FME17]|nr:hypothetical protein [Brevibacterium sp. FME17]